MFQRPVQFKKIAVGKILCPEGLSEARSERLFALAKSVERYGLIRPVVLRPIPGGYFLLSGRRRLTAARMAGVKRIEAVVLRLSDRDRALIMMAQANLTPRHFLDEAAQFDRAARLNASERDISDASGHSLRDVAEKRRLAKLPLALRQFIRDHHLSQAEAISLASLPPEARRELLTTADQPRPNAPPARPLYETLDRMKREGTDFSLATRESADGIILHITLPKAARKAE